MPPIRARRKQKLTNAASKKLTNAASEKLTNVASKKLTKKSDSDTGNINIHIISSTPITNYGPMVGVCRELSLFDFE